MLNWQLPIGRLMVSPLEQTTMVHSLCSAASVSMMFGIFGKFVLWLAVYCHLSHAIRSPIILIPGDGGSQIDGKLSKLSVPHYFCDQKTSHYFSLWLNLEQLMPFLIDCWVDNIRLVYDETTRTTRNSPGVDIQIPGFGNTSTVEFVDPSRMPISGYYNYMAEELVKAGYRRGVDLRGAPYDFRKAPNELGEYFVKVKELIEETYSINDERPSILVCHSMGCTIMLYFLNHQTQAWKTKHVRSLFSLAGPWGGAIKTVKAFASGDNFGVIVVPSLTLRDDERTFPSLAFLMPSDKVFNKNKVVIETRTKNYTVNDYEELFDDINYRVGYNMWLDVRDLIYELEAPGTEVFCIHGTGSETIEALVYDRNRFPDNQPDRIRYGNGDGTVNIESLSACRRWSTEQNEPVHYIPLQGQDHMQLLYNQDIVARLLKHARLN